MPYKRAGCCVFSWSHNITASRGEPSPAEIVSAGQRWELLAIVQTSINRVGGGLSSVALGTVAATSWTTQRLSQSFR